MSDVTTEQIAVAQFGEAKLCQGNVKLCQRLVLLADGELGDTRDVDIESQQLLVFWRRMFYRVEVFLFFLIRYA